MTDPLSLALLREAVPHLEHPVAFALRRRTLARRIRDHIEDVAADGARPIAVTLARRLSDSCERVSVDPDETITRRTPDGVAVRAWLLIPFRELPLDDPDREARILLRLMALAPRTREIYMMNQVGGLNFAEIASRLRISERRVRGHMRRAIRQLVTPR